MKNIFTLGLFLLISFNTFSQDYYHSINKSEYDSLKSHTWYKGRVFFKGGSFVDGWIHRVPDEPVLQFKLYEGDDKFKLKDIQTDILTAHKVDGFYNVYEEDTAFFVFLQEKQKELPKAYRILINDPEGISLLRLSWLEAEESKIAGFFGSNAYAIRWSYYIWKDQKLNHIFFLNDLKRAIKDKPNALSFFNRYKKKIDSTDEHYTYLSNLINIYNYEKEN